VTAVARRSYDQYCGLARALDVLGERWALLVVRELLIGPKRFSDLQEGLPGIGANALSTRLRSLEQDGLIAKRRLPPPAASTVYELTERGRALTPAVRELTRWGVELLGSPRPEDRFRPGWIVTALTAMFDPALAENVRRSYALKVGEVSFSIRVANGSIDVRQAEDPAADVVLSTDEDTLFAIGSRELDAEEAIDRGRLVVERGDRAEALALAAMLGRPAAALA
jgi:DNA-binding HxlR family transcriptional regulator